jgi:hypothetical protein
VNEPELGYVAVAVGPVPETSTPAPANAVVAVIETDVDIRYLVRRGGIGGNADAVTSKPVAATGHGTDTIGVKPGDVISFIEA